MRFFVANDPYTRLPGRGKGHSRAVKRGRRDREGPPKRSGLSSVSQSVSHFTVPPRAHPSTGSQSGSATPGQLTVKRISTTDRTHARTGPDTQRAQAHNHTQNSNSRTHPRQTSRSQLHTHHLPPAPHLPLLISLAAVIGAALPSGRKQGNLTSLAAPRLLACCQWSCKRPPSAAPGDALA